MSKDYFCQVWVTCAGEEEATKISEALLEKQLIACAKQIVTKSQFRWQGKIEQDDEIILVMDTREELFKEIEKLVNELHSYDTPNIQALSVLKVSDKTRVWLNEELK